MENNRRQFLKMVAAGAAAATLPAPPLGGAGPAYARKTGKPGGCATGALTSFVYRCAIGCG